MMQVKLFELMDAENTLNQITSMFGDESIFKFSDSIIGIAYNYEANSYVEILKKVKGLNMRQVIVASSSFLNVIDYCVKKEFGISKLNFVYPVSEENVKYVYEYIEQINATTGKTKISNKMELFKELDWITSDECIDIKSISFDIANEEGIYYGVELYNNGVLLINHKSIIKSVTPLIIQIFE